MESFVIGMMMIPILLVAGPILGVIVLVGMVSNPRLTLRRIARVTAAGAALLLLVDSLMLFPMPKDSATAWIAPLIGIAACLACGWLVYLLRPRTDRRLRGGRLSSGNLRTSGSMFQQFFLTANTSVLDNVTLPLKIAGVSARERRARGLAALKKFGLEDKAKNRARDLSGGQKQRVVLTRALVGEPAVIFADEPTGNLDSATGGPGRGGAIPAQPGAADHARDRHARRGSCRSV